MNETFVPESSKRDFHQQCWLLNVDSAAAKGIISLCWVSFRIIYVIHTKHPDDLTVC